MKVLSLFSGIGAFEKALENLERYKDLLEDLNDSVDLLDKEDEKDGLEAEERLDVRAKLINILCLVDLWLQEEEQKEKE